MIGLNLSSQHFPQSKPKTVEYAALRSPLKAALAGALLAALAVFFSACTPAEVAIIGSTSTITYMEEGKTLPDKVISGLFGKDCAFSYYYEIDKLCKEPEITYEAPVYCYPSLGRVDCYAHPNPYDPRVEPVGGMAQMNRQKEEYDQYMRGKRNTLVNAPRPLPPPTFLEEEAEPFTEPSSDDAAPMMSPSMPPAAPLEAPMMNEPSGYNIPQKKNKPSNGEMVKNPGESADQSPGASTSLAESLTAPPES